MRRLLVRMTMVAVLMMAMTLQNTARRCWLVAAAALTELAQKLQTTLAVGPQPQPTQQVELSSAWTILQNVRRWWMMQQQRLRLRLAKRSLPNHHATGAAAADKCKCSHRFLSQLPDDAIAISILLLVSAATCVQLLLPIFVRRRQCSHHHLVTRPRI